MIDSHASLQSSNGCKLNAMARVVELTYLNVVIKCESLWGGHGKARKTVNLGFLFKLLLSPHTTIVSLTYLAPVWNDFGLHPVYLLPLWSRAVNNQVPITF